ncbi:MAG: glutamate--cysteine ligase [Corynebacterium sp.]|nr:glutamate--cysteine ligase [Corynebacterium sp.]
MSDSTGVQPFARSEKPTLGVEWEVGIIDARTGDLVPMAGPLIEAAHKIDPDLHVEREFLANTVEVVSPIFESASEVSGFLEKAKSTLTEASKSASELTGFPLGLWAAGCHPFAQWDQQVLTEKYIYEEIIERTQFWGRHMLIWGVHVHIGCRHEDRVWPLINAMLMQLPHILALSASSPYWQGVDTGYVSHRTMLYQQLPTAGIPPQFHSWEEYSSYVDDQMHSGVINHTGAMHFDIRPASKWGTIEIRIADSVADPAELASVVALIHCLYIYYDRLIDEQGIEALPSLQDWHVRENKWRAARYGLDAIVITSRDTDEKLVTEDLADWVEKLTPIAEEFGCLSELRGIFEIIKKGNPATRMRKALASGESLVDVVKKTWQ